MKRLVAAVVVAFCAGAGVAAPIRVALLDFDDQTGAAPEAALGGALRPGSLVQKGPYLLAKQLLDREGFVLVDRRELLAEMGREESAVAEAGGAKPSVLRAAQALRADVVLRGSLISFSTGGERVRQGGYGADFTKLSVRVALEALDATDGTVLAVADGMAEHAVRQTPTLRTELSEADVLEAFEKALAAAVPAVAEKLQERKGRLESQRKVKVSIQTSADPALVELDGLLVGTTPIRDLEVYEGDHVLTVGKPGYRDVSKRILFQKDLSIEVPMIRTTLSADELKEVLEKMRLSVVVGEPALVIHTVGD